MQVRIAGLRRARGQTGGPYRRRRGVARRLGWILTVAVVLAGVGAIVLPAATGRAKPPEFSRASAEAALERAREAGTSAWAPARFEVAEERLREARVEFRRQELRLYPLRNFERARDLFRSAEVAAESATVAASERRQGAKHGAESAVAKASCVVGLTERLSRQLRFGDATAASARHAALRLKESELLLGEGEYDSARSRAEEAIAESRLARERMASRVGRYVDPDDVRLWSLREAETIAWSAENGKPAIVVNKDEARLTLFVAGRPVRTYPVELGRNHLGRKLHRGDLATPEGRYRVTSKKKGPGETKYYKALVLSYPNDEDRERVRREVARRALPSGTGPGGMIEIHGHGGRGWDWTEGCVSLTDEDIDDLFPRVPPGTPVTIVGGRGRGGRFSEIARVLETPEDDYECRNE